MSKVPYPKHISCDKSVPHPEPNAPFLFFVLYLLFFPIALLFLTFIFLLLPLIYCLGYWNLLLVIWNFRRVVRACPCHGGPPLQSPMPFALGAITAPYDFI
ncbi:MAG: hypothetical protein L6428_11150 [Candidatus Aminicenantes bacterium]|nr:hypothetical protein [Candidatus Aminicenantes bacterium]